MIGFRDYTEDIPSADDYLRHIVPVPTFRPTASVFLLQCEIVVYKAVVALSMAVVRLKVERNAKNVEVSIEEGAGHDVLVKILERQRLLQAKVAGLLGSISQRDRGFLVPTTLRLLEDILLILDDTIETLELSVDPEVREHLACEIQRIAASHSPDSDVRTST